MYENGKIYMGLAGDKRVELALNMCNRHGSPEPAAPARPLP